MDWWALATAVAICIATAGAEGALSGKELPRWLASLAHPRLYAPLWAWVAAALATYLIQGLVAYRLLAGPLATAGWLALAALIAVMAANVAYNVILDRTRDARWAFVGLLYFLPLLAVLQLCLFFADRPGFWAHLAYAAWVVLYDLPVMHGLWKLNPERRSS